MSDPTLDNVILFPKTEQFYEDELTKLLRSEQYKEALDMLAFLLQFPNVDTNKSEQWEALRHWLLTMFPETMFPSCRGRGRGFRGRIRLIAAVHS